MLSSVVRQEPELSGHDSLENNPGHQHFVTVILA